MIWQGNFSKVLAFACIGSIITYLYTFNFHPKLTYSYSEEINNTLSNNSKHCNVILPEPIGRLGNLLFQFASAYGLSLDYSCRLYIPSDFIKDLRQYFEINISNLLTISDFNGTLPGDRLYNHCTYFPKLFYPNTSQSIQLVGYWQAQKHFVNHTDQIRSQLRFTKKILDQVNNFTNTNINRSTSTLVGIHIRRGDYIGQRSISSNKYIFNAMNYFKRKYHSVYFIIVSDDKPYCRRVFAQRNDTFITPDSFDPAEDMAVITRCDHAIITVGTYGWWSAFLLHNRIGEIITDSKPDFSPLDVDCEGSVYFPHWFTFLNKTG